MKIEVKKIVGILLILILLLDMIEGFRIRVIDYRVCGHSILAENILIFALIYIIILIAYKKLSSILMIEVIVIILSLMITIFENQITDYQYKRTSENLNLICSAIQEYQNENERIPDKLIDLYPKYLEKIPKSGFGVINSKILYDQTEKSYNLNYKVMNGYKCNISNCEDFISEEYTCIECASLNPNDTFMEMFGE